MIQIETVLESNWQVVITTTTVLSELTAMICFRVYLSGSLQQWWVCTQPKHPCIQVDPQFQDHSWVTSVF